jgi:hypothetical protein
MPNHFQSALTQWWVALLLQLPAVIVKRGMTSGFCPVGKSRISDINWLLIRVQNEGQNFTSSVLASHSAKLHLTTSLVVHNTPGSLEGRIRIPVIVHRSLRISHMHANPGWGSTVCLPRSKRITRGSFMPHKWQEGSSKLPCIRHRQKRNQCWLQHDLLWHPSHSLQRLSDSPFSFTTSLDLPFETPNSASSFSNLPSFSSFWPWFSPQWSVYLNSNPCSPIYYVVYDFGKLFNFLMSLFPNS